MPLHHLGEAIFFFIPLLFVCSFSFHFLFFFFCTSLLPPGFPFEILQVMHFFKVFFWVSLSPHIKPCSDYLFNILGQLIASYMWLQIVKSNSEPELCREKFCTSDGPVLRFKKLSDNTTLMFSLGD